MIYSIAIDLGASSGRVMLSSYDGISLTMEEVHRFKNSPFETDKRFYWDLAYLIDEIIKGLKKVASRKHKINSIGFDTWGVDFGCLDESGDLISNPISYRDESTKAIMDDVHTLISEYNMYRITGIQPSYFNTIYRLYDHNNKIDKILLLPSLLSYIFSGVIKNEYTITSTSQLIDFDDKTYSDEIFDVLSVDKDKMADLVQPGEVLGVIDKNLAIECGLNLDVQVIAVPGHDTACAVAVKPNAINSAFVVLGTWTIVGVELDKSIRSEAAFNLGFTNEAGVFNTNRFLKNITGLWVLNQVKEVYEDRKSPISFDDITTMARAYEGKSYSVDIQEERFNNPINMYDEVETYLRERYRLSDVDFPLMLYAIFNGMAELIADTIQSIERLNVQIDNIGVLGGGSKNKFLLQLIGQKTMKTVLSGPVEASALGNTLMQFYGLNVLESLEEIRSVAQDYSSEKE